jgi:hypothetical protein
MDVPFSKRPFKVYAMVVITRRNVMRRETGMLCHLHYHVFYVTTPIKEQTVVRCPSNLTRPTTTSDGK